MRRPMILLALGIAVLDEHTRLAHLESDGTPLSLLLAANRRSSLPSFFRSSLPKERLPR